MACYFIETFTENPWRNLAVEQALAERIGPGDVILYLWNNERTVVIGRGQNAMRECRGPLLESEGGYLARRSTGGGAVYHDLGNLCFTFAASPECYDLQRQLRVIAGACEMFGIKTVVSGRNDILSEEGFKFSGNAFSVMKNYKIQHGTLMIDLDTSMLQRYLTPSELKLKSKGIQSVRSRVCNLKQLNEKITVPLMREALKKAYVKEYGDIIVLADEFDQDERCRELYEHFSSWEWRYGKSPACEMHLEHLFPWGELQIHFNITNMTISQCSVFTDSLDPEFGAFLQNYLTGRQYTEKGIGAEQMKHDDKAQAAWSDTKRQEQLADVLMWLHEEILKGAE